MATYEKKGIAVEIDSSVSNVWGPGSTVKAVVKVDIPRMLRDGIEEVYAELVGLVKCGFVESGRFTGPVASYQETQTFLNLKTNVCKVQDTASPAKEIGTLPAISSFPISFVIPEHRTLPPSFSYSDYHIAGQVQYFIKVVAIKSAWYKPNVEIRTPFKFLPWESSEPGTVSLAQQRSFRKESRMRRNAIFRDEAKVEAEIYLPDVEALPAFQPIPFSIRIRCVSKPLPQASSSSPSTFTFPIPPLSSDRIQFELQEHISVQSRGDRRSSTKKYPHLGGFGVQSSDDQMHPVIRSEIGDPIWEQSDKSAEGRWSQTVLYHSSFRLNGWPPSFSTAMLGVQYTFELGVPFPGLGNDLKMKVEGLAISSGLFRPSTSGAAAFELPPCAALYQLLIRSALSHRYNFYFSTYWEAVAPTTDNSLMEDSKS
ncbi:hypothetical protein SISSUDRAFT_1048720 [Sistotremastrum suecicum HHB10207 ss-3]|uniref:Arrestin-like N-terminal domain-containing protein n=1 Tax=Sistotremastrum suecicum HHB10207 ss-3 TaxID=1314776 RepID=A0A166CBG9_9AGAM|nr:hypothetical protein SISSUDRAFT_1048720 [Sistotremastrum suecicum HHB10207 ss-3]